MKLHLKTSLPVISELLLFLLSLIRRLELKVVFLDCFDMTISFIPFSSFLIPCLIGKQFPLQREEACV